MCNRLNIRLLLVISCFQWFKDTKMKANHNCRETVRCGRLAVFQWFKDKQMKANHNVCVRVCVYLFSKDSES